ncbi:hypothetical protein KGQ20_03835 [Catenulispora sp. NF23]|uniref:hypothetical protein n=1 Tax=Catenulispora pinistramenti TaxID=2705254 RepID=UPI001BAC76A7|nr:hypothetical protein [Catenulispora pinistramenti]MBS2531897.1 hypothetical protein [Catenulispora pinistramenti]
MADLIVDFDALTAMQSSLTFVSNEFQSLGGDVNTIDHAQGWGSEKIRSGMDTFQHNWRDHRAKLESAITALLQMVTQTTQAFQDVDHQLAQAMTDAQTEQVRT